MFKPLKKRTITYKITQGTITFVYLFVIFAAPSNHTCNLCKKTSRHHCDNTGHCCSTETHEDTQPGISSKQGTPEAETTSHSSICTACLYSLISKFTQVSTDKVLISITKPDFFRIPPAFKVITQSEWGSSVFLRAPPIIIS